MSSRRTALSAFLAVGLASAPALAQDRTASAVGFGGLSVNSVTSSSSSSALSTIDFGVDIGKELTPNIQAIGEFGHIGNMLPSLTSGLLSSTQYNIRVSAFYGEGGIRLLAAPGSGVNPYVEATAGIARLMPQASGFGSTVNGLVAGLGLFHSTDPILGFGGGLLLRGGPVVADIGYRYKQIAGGDSFANLLSPGQPLRAHQARFGIGVRF